MGLLPLQRDELIANSLHVPINTHSHISPEACCHLLMLVCEDGTEKASEALSGGHTLVGKFLRDRWLAPSQQRGQQVADTLRVLLATYCGYNYKRSGDGSEGRLPDWSSRRQAMAKRVLVTAFAPSQSDRDAAVIAAMRKISSSSSFPLIKAEVARMLCWVRLSTMQRTYLATMV